MLRQCSQRCGTPLWVNLAAVVMVEVVAQGPETFTRIWFDTGNCRDIRETPSDLQLIEAAR